MRKWVRTGVWKTSAGAPVKNRPLLAYLEALLQLRDARKQTWRLQHVYGHTGEEGNEAADALARAGTALPRVLDEDDWDAKRAAVEDAVYSATVVRGAASSVTQRDDGDAMWGDLDLDAIDPPHVAAANACACSPLLLSSPDPGQSVLAFRYPMPRSFFLLLHVPPKRLNCRPIRPGGTIWRRLDLPLLREHMRAVDRLLCSSARRRRSRRVGSVSLLDPGESRAR